jgi:H+/gluconate symporter-like permease
MNFDLHIGLSILIGAIIAIPLVILLILLRQSRFRKNFPDEGRKQELISSLVSMKRAGKNYSERLAFLQSQGFHKDVADVLLGEAERAG